MGLFPKLGGIIAAMPESVIGGAAIIMFGLITSAGIKLVAQSEMSQRNLLILGLSLSFGLGLSMLPQFVSHIPDFGISFKLLLTTGLIPAGLLAFVLNATLSKKYIKFCTRGDTGPHKQGLNLFDFNKFLFLMFWHNSFTSDC